MKKWAESSKIEKCSFRPNANMLEAFLASGRLGTQVNGKMKQNGCTYVTVMLHREMSVHHRVNSQLALDIFRPLVIEHLS